MKITHTYLLLLFLISILSPPLYSLPLETQLLDSSCKKLSEIDTGASKSFFSTDSTKSFQAGERSTALGGFKSILETAKGALGNFFVAPTSTPENSSTSWEVCYDVSQKALKSSTFPEVKEIAKAVEKLGSQFDLHHDNPQAKIKHIMYTINLCYISLENDFLNTAERIWSVGVISFLRSQVPEGMSPKIPSLWTADDLGRPRGSFLMFFLQDKDLGQVIEEMWSKSPSDLGPTRYGKHQLFCAFVVTDLPSYISVIQEIIQRESIVHLIKRQISMNTVRPSTDFQTIYLAFINSKTLMDPKKAASLMELIGNHLNHQKTKRIPGFDEDENSIRLLLHLEEYHYNLEFKELIKKQTIRDKILERDLTYQIADEKLSPYVRNLLEEFKTRKTVDDHQITKISKVLEVEVEKMSIAQVGRFIRVLNLLSKINAEIYTWFTRRVDKSPQMVSKLSNILLKYRRGRMNPSEFVWRDLECLILSKHEDQAAETYRKNLRNLLISEGVFSSTELAAIRSPSFLGYGKIYVVSVTLHDVFKRMLALKDVSFTHQDQKNTDMIVEYILHLISFKNDDKKLYRHLIVDKHVPENFNLYKKLSNLVFQFVYDRSWDRGGRYHIMIDALKVLEQRLSDAIEERN
ncbi:hypothetical protein DFH28DRAFT_541385 [Melampsora americana]|nr:hypothetical protein DFH28DRAFT_541385 [Melampsora americana]